MYCISFKTHPCTCIVTLSIQDTQKTLKAQMRERVRPKLGKMDIDYQKLHDAFFRSVYIADMILVGLLMVSFKYLCHLAIAPRLKVEI